MPVVPSFSRAPTRVAWLVATLLVAACGNQTGILLEIHKDDGVASEVYELQVFVGVGHDAQLYDPAWRVAAILDQSISHVTLDAELGAGVYRLLLEPGADLVAGQDLIFAVAGYKAAQRKPNVFGHSDRPVQFGGGEVRVIDLPLATFRDASHGVTPTGCVWWNTAGDRSKQDAIVPRDDGDCDGFKAGHDETAGCQLDCNDMDPAIHPGATEICANGIDENCCDDNDGRLDLDGDGYATCGDGPHDCVDGARGGVGAETAFGDNLPPEEIHPGAVELCDGVDNDCNGACDELAEFDGDGDGYLNCTRGDGATARTVGVHRVGATCVASPLDCADHDPVGGVAAAEIHPGAADNQCDGVDQDCDGSCDQQLVGVDADGDGFDACTTEDGYLVPGVPQCALGTGADCGGDSSRFAYPGGAERCDGIDFDCDGVLFPAMSPCFLMTTEGSGGAHCAIGRRTCNDTPGAVDAGFGACTRDTTAPVLTLPDNYCQLTCDATTDPVQCVTDARVDCVVHFEPVVNTTASTAVCPTPPTEVMLPADGGGVGGCTYALIGGHSQGQWAVTLVDPLGVAGVTATGCGSKLRVTGAAPAAEPRNVLVVSGQAPHLFRLERKDGCDPTSNMTCTGN